MLFNELSSANDLGEETSFSLIVAKEFARFYVSPVGTASY
jgi:hypothetical protein